MSLEIAFSSAKLPARDSVALVIAGDKLGQVASEVDKATGGALSRAMKAQGFKGKAGESLLLHAAGPYAHVVLVSAGAPDKLDDLALQAAGGHVWAALARTKAKTAALAVEATPKGRKHEHPAALAAFGAQLRSYRFDKYRTKLKDEDKPQLASLTLHAKEAATAKKDYHPLEAVAQGVYLTRDIVSEPPNILHPESYADICTDLRKFGLKVTVLDLAALRKHKMGALIGVAQGSVREPRVVCIEWNGNPKAKDKAPLALLGKGVTFDTGGISIKPSGGMEEMKWDMAGSGAVVGTMVALALRKAKANVVGVIGLVENMPDGNAQRPSDIVTSMSGQTIEVLNTDAEGRLVLCDVMTYAQRTYKPKAMIDLATLTGAVIIALGHVHAAVLSNNQKLADNLIAAGKASGETLWQLPAEDAYDKDIDSPVADMKNIGPAREAGTVVGAIFLKRFVENNTPWAHLDIAGTAWAYKDTALCAKGASAYGVRLLNRFVADHFED
jgi:leucyl aminopeptidase